MMTKDEEAPAEVAPPKKLRTDRKMSTKKKMSARRRSTSPLQSSSAASRPASESVEVSVDEVFPRDEGLPDKPLTYGEAMQYFHIHPGTGQRVLEDPDDEAQAAASCSFLSIADLFLTPSANSKPFHTQETQAYEDALDPSSTAARQTHQDSPPAAAPTDNHKQHQEATTLSSFFFSSSSHQ